MKKKKKPIRTVRHKEIFGILVHRILVSKTEKYSSSRDF